MDNHLLNIKETLTTVCKNFDTAISKLPNQINQNDVYYSLYMEVWNSSLIIKNIIDTLDILCDSSTD